MPSIDTDDLSRSDTPTLVRLAAWLISRGMGGVTTVLVTRELQRRGRRVA